jgi:hypothetical protein
MSTEEIQMEKLSLDRPNIQLGEIIASLARNSGKRVYDLADGELLVLAENERKEPIMSQG